METANRFSCPTKVHFTSTADGEVGAVIVDCLMKNKTETVFYLGKIRVAVLNERYLIIGFRKIPRCTLDPDKPFFCKSPNSDD